MSRADVDLVHHFTAAYNAGDMRSVRAICTPDVIGVPDPAVWPESSPVSGPDGLTRLLEDSRSTWEGCVHEIREVLDLGDGRVVAHGVWAGTGTASRAEVNQSLTPIYTVRDGRISKVQWFFNHAEALEAAGLSE